ncbi:AlpA family transcriptional regulator [Mesorhizobium sp. M4A.F.Ca.ET.050.02.1.1]|uniref:helix-turn-helix transcriptional regulator n=1 Tax=Mesorhizobium sp. M4A.F.Ca.ET.050.02.1.1 TaxID=2496754 RepID=UPI000FC9AF79|nr:AlpA family transcriptional regulator [Mesorhizobium sp. M4A.F.Ca.ET.050.02.1.1]RUX42140.1 AlpA family transcriptional regulator [Mesorhizobium sp. M4A.F.Ca.ET.050.02.1.1]
MTTERVVLREPEATRYTGLPTSTMYDKILRGTFPKPIKLGAKSVGWLKTELDAWIEARIAERDAKAAGK